MDFNDKIPPFKFKKVKISLSRVAITCGWLLVPTVTSLGLLVFLNKLDLVLALVVLFSSIVGSFLVSWYFASDFKVAGDYVRVLLQNTSGEPPPTISPKAGVLRDFARHIDQMDRQYRTVLATMLRKQMMDEQILMTLLDPLLVVDYHGQIIRVNPAAEALWKGKKSLLYMPYLDLLPMSPVQPAVHDPNVPPTDPLTAVLNSQQTHISEISLVIGGSPKIFQIRLVPYIRDEDGLYNDEVVFEDANQAAIITLYDITSIRETERMRDQFITDVSHELRTPLTMIQGFVETLQHSPPDDPELEQNFLQIIHTQSLRMSRLVEDLLAISRIELEESQPPLTIVNLGQVLQSVCQGMNLRAQQQNIEFQYRLPQSAMPVYGDADRLAQVFTNLLDNAMKYSVSGSGIQVQTEFVTNTKGKFYCIHIQDQGEGMAEEHIPHLGNRFYRVPLPERNATRAAAKGGVGLGLAIAKHILNRHRGFWKVESIKAPSKNHGTTFFVYIPAA